MSKTVSNHQISREDLDTVQPSYRSQHCPTYLGDSNKCLVVLDVYNKNPQAYWLKQLK